MASTHEELGPLDLRMSRTGLMPQLWRIGPAARLAPGGVSVARAPASAIRRPDATDPDARVRTATTAGS